jgi:aromatic aminotransferase
MSSSTSQELPSVSSRIQSTLDPCVVLMKELIGRYAHLWNDKGGIYSLAQGVVYWKPPPQVSTALIQALQDDDTAAATAPLLHTYGPDEGLPELREAIQKKIQRENALTNHNVMITVGANQAYTNCILSLVNQDQKVIVFAPYYFNHVMAIQMALPSESLVVGPCSDDGIPDLTWLEETLLADPSIHVVTIVNPGNPTGVTLSRQVLQRAVDLCRDHKAWLILDCTYEYFVNVNTGNSSSRRDESYDLGGCFPDPHVIHVFSFSKSYAMAGYRCGYVVMSRQHETLFAEMLKVQDTIPIAPPRISQIAVLAAMQEGDDNGAGKQWVLEQFDTLQTGRQAIIQALRTMNGPIMGGSGAM